MFKRRFTLFQVAGIKINADVTWLLLAALIVTSLAMSWFPLFAEGLPQMSYWFMAVVGAAGLFTSILIHEMCHALVGRRYNMQVKEISLFLFGGVAHLENEPPTPKSEALMALAGPVASLALSAIFYGLYRITSISGSAPLIPALFSYLYSINIVVAIFNMLPGFPLDGGRVLRALIWQLKGDLLWATKIASTVGQLFGWGLLILGVFTFFAGGPGDRMSGIWAALIGLLLSGFARASYMQLVVRKALHGKKAAVFMNSKPFTVTLETNLSDLFRESLYSNPNDESVIPVLSSNHEVLGCIDLQKAKKMLEDQKLTTQVIDVMRSCSPEMSINPDIDAESAFTRMIRTGNRLLLVTENRQLLGVLSQSALTRYLSLSGTT
jgi:Zn-dependent protease/CBS domain-containing protein